MATRDQTPTAGVDLDGKPVLYIRLDPAHVCKLFPEDYARLVADGYGPTWRFASSGNGFGYVRVGRAKFAGRNRTVARLIVGPEPFRNVRHNDGNPLNLRRDNLRVGGRQGLDTPTLEPPPTKKACADLRPCAVPVLEPVCVKLESPRADTPYPHFPDVRHTGKEGEETQRDFTRSKLDRKFIH